MNGPTYRPAPTDGPDGCPEPDAVAQYAEGLLGERRRSALEAHVVGCDACRSLVAALARAGLAVDGAVASASTGTLRTLPRWIPIAAAACVLAAGLTFVLRSGPSSPAAPSDTEARLVAVATRLATERPELFGGWVLLDVSERAAGGIDVQRGGIELMSPAGVTVETRPTFEWADVDGSSEYRVSVIDSGGARVFTTTSKAARLEGASLPKALTRGGDYVWKVTAVGSATPAEGTCALHVTDESDARDYADVVAAVAAITDDTLRDLATAHALLRRGLVADALPFARRFATAHPGDSVGRDTLAFVRRRLSSATKPR